MEKNQADSVAGVMDTARVAAFLEIEPARIHTWVARQGKKGGRIADLFPTPIPADSGGNEPGLVNRGFVWHKADIEAFALVLEAYKPAGGRTPARLKGRP